MTRRDSIDQFIQCKLEGICARDKLATAFTKGRLEITLESQRSELEVIRQHHQLPPCPPVCPDPVVV